MLAQPTRGRVRWQSVLIHFQREAFNAACELSAVRNWGLGETCGNTCVGSFGPDHSAQVDDPIDVAPLAALNIFSVVCPAEEPEHLGTASGFDSFEL